MRTVVLYTLMSLDGAVDDPTRYFGDGQQASAEPTFDAVMDEHEAHIVATQDCVLLGRGMYDEWSRYWPTVSDHPFADFINSVDKYVVTSTPLTGGWSNCRRVERPLPEFVAELQAAPGRDIGVHGSITLAQSMLSAGLVDRLQLVVGPTVGHPGRRLFAGLAASRGLHLRNVRPTPSGSLLLDYDVQQPPTGDDRSGRSWQSG